MPRHVYYYELLATPFEDAARTLAGDPRGWLPEPAEPWGEAWLVDLRADGALPGGLAKRRAVVRVGQVPERSLATAEGDVADNGQAKGLLRPVRWEAAEASEVFPVLSADLELDALQGDGCQLSLMGTYRPPLSVVGEATDRLLGHRVAEATVRRFVLDVAARLARHDVTASR